MIDNDLQKAKENVAKIAPQIKQLNNAGLRDYAHYKLDGQFDRGAIDSAVTQLEAGEQVSSVLTGIGITIFGQEGPKQLPEFQKGPTQMIRIRTDLPNGTLSKFYKVAGKTDDLSGVAPVTIDDFNAEVTKATNETFFPDIEKHAKMKVYNPSVNDFALKVALFTELASNEYYEMTKPIELFWLQVGYRLIADISQRDFTTTGLTKPVPMKYSIEKEFDTEEDRISFINTKLRQWKDFNKDNVTDSVLGLPQGPNPFTKDDFWAVGGRDGKLFVTQEFMNNLQTKTQAHMLAPQLSAINGAEVETFIPSSAFTTLANVTGVDKDTFIFITDGAIDYLMLYDDGKTMPTPKLYDIRHEYWKFGVAVDKEEMLVTMHLTLKAPTPAKTEEVKADEEAKEDTTKEDK